MKEVVNLFSTISSGHKLGRTHKITAHADPGYAKPFKKRQYPMSPYMLEHLNKELDTMLRLGVVEPSFSPWNSPMFLVKKNNANADFVYMIAV